MQPTPIKLPPKRRIIQKEQQQDQRQFSVVPIRAITDRNLTPMELRVLMMFCSYANRGGLTWVGLQRLADHFGVKINRIAVITRSLISKGYMRVLYKGFKGARAHTRQIIFNKELSLEDIVAVSGEPAPYMVENTIKHQPTTHKGETMSRKRKTEDNLSLVTDSKLGKNVVIESKSHLVITESQVLQLQRAVGADMLQYALSQCGDAPTLEQVQTKLKELLS